MNRRRIAFTALSALLILRGNVHAQKIEAFMSSVAGAWSRADADGLANLTSRQGVALEVDGAHVSSISPRQAAAVLKRVFDDRRTIRATAGTARLLPGTKDRAYAEVIWERRTRGTTESEKVNVFFALVRDGEGWHITEIRLMQ